MDFNLGFALLLHGSEDQKEIPNIHANLHAVGIGLAVVRSVHQPDIGLRWVIHNAIQCSGSREKREFVDCLRSGLGPVRESFCHFSRPDWETHTDQGKIRSSCHMRAKFPYGGQPWRIWRNPSRGGVMKHKSKKQPSRHEFAMALKTIRAQFQTLESQSDTIHRQNQFMMTIWSWTTPTPASRRKSPTRFWADHSTAGSNPRWVNDAGSTDAGSEEGPLRFSAPLVIRGQLPRAICARNCERFCGTNGDTVFAVLPVFET